MTRPAPISPISRWARIKELAPKIGRVLTLFACVYAAAFAWTAYTARADVREVMFGVGAEMMRMADAHRQSEPRALMLNGQRMWMSTSASRTASLTQALDAYETRCKQKDGSFVLPANLPAEARDALPNMPQDTTVRFEEEGRGVVACIDTGADTLSLTDLATRIQAFGRSGDLLDIGGLRYAYVERKHGETFAVTFWTDDHFNVRSAFPKTGDAPGRDLPNVPRPTGSRRILSTWEDGEPHSLTVYAFGNQTAEALAQFYDRELPRQGWQVTVADPTRLHRPRNAREHVFEAERSGRSMFLIVGQDREQRGTATVFTTR